VSNELPWWVQLLCITAGIAFYNEVALPLVRYIVRKAKESQ